MRAIIITIILFSFGYNATSKITKVPQLIRNDGYEVEVHRVMTDDGYVLEMHRIPFPRITNQGRNSSTTAATNSSKPIAFMMHCALCTSAVFVVLGPTTGLAYRLANEGYDVWMLNGRGTSYSRRHRIMSAKSNNFWKYGLTEQSIFDVTASMDYALKYTNETQVDYIGFSMGTTEFFMLMAERPEYNKKIRSMIAMAPAAFVSDSFGLMASVVPLTKTLISYGVHTNSLEMPPPEFGFRALMYSVCKSKISLFRALCILGLNSFGAEDNGNIDMKLLPFFLKYFPETISLRAVVHFSQLHTSGNFQQFDFGRRRNMKYYNTTKPPMFDLKKVTAPVSIFYGSGDRLTPPQGIKKLIHHLPNCVYTYNVPFRKFSHMDFVWGRNANSLVYNEIIKRLKLPATYTRLKEE